LSNLNHQIDRANDFADLCHAQGDTKHVQQHMQKLLDGIEGSNGHG
jgi:hypothetical protein